MRELRGAENVQNLDLGDGYVGIHLCETASSYTLKICLCVDYTSMKYC